MRGVQTLPWRGNFTGPSRCAPMDMSFESVPSRSPTEKFRNGEYPVEIAASLMKRIKIKKGKRKRKRKREEKRK